MLEFFERPRRCCRDTHAKGVGIVGRTRLNNPHLLLDPTPQNMTHCTDSVTVLFLKIYMIIVFIKKGVDKIPQVKGFSLIIFQGL